MNAQLHLTVTQFARFAVVGLVSNAALYVGYLLLTGMGLGPKLAMSLMYVTGVGATFVFNRRWSFEHGGGAPAALARYVAVYLFGYVLNLAVLMLLVDRLGLDHRIVQGAMILLLAVLIFMLQKFWVFRAETR